MPAGVWNTPVAFSQEHDTLTRAHTHARADERDSNVDGEYALDSFVTNGDDTGEMQDEVSDVSSSHICEVCTSPEDAEMMLLCDRCNDGYHIQCLSPPLPYIPPGDWYCNGCISAMRDVERRGAARKVNYGQDVQWDADDATQGVHDNRSYLI